MKKKMAVVDDDICILESFEVLFGDEYEVVYLRNPERALDFFRKEVPSLIFLDLLMPGMDGFEVLERIRDMKKDSRIVLITASDVREEDERLEGVYLLRKPFDIDELRKITKEALGGPVYKPRSLRLVAGGTMQ